MDLVFKFRVPTFGVSNIRSIFWGSPMGFESLGFYGLEALYLKPYTLYSEPSTLRLET
jgi:hypothetical protein